MTTPESDGPQNPIPAGAPQATAPTSTDATMTLPAQPPVVKAPMGLAIAALIVGIAAFLFGLIPVFGALVGIAAVVLGILALRKRQSKGMAIAGLVLGSIAILASMGTAIGLGTAVNNASFDKPVAVVDQSAEPTVDESPSSEPVETKKAEPEAPAVSAEFKSALKKAKSYSDIMHMSKAGLYDQLTSEYGEKFSPDAAQYAVDNVNADWNANALAKAKSYQDTMAMSPAAIHDQLTSEYGEQFTVEQADYAIQHLND